VREEKERDSGGRERIKSAVIRRPLATLTKDQGGMTPKVIVEKKKKDS